MMKRDSLSLPLQHGSLDFRWRKGMLGYIGRRKKLAFQLVLSLVPLMLMVPAYARAQTQSPRPTDRPPRARNKAPKKQSPERAFVLVGAGDIASCKNPEGDRKSTRLNSSHSQISYAVFCLKKKKKKK